MKRIAVLVSGGGTNLQALIDAQGRGEIPHGEIVLVISNKEGAYALERAAKAGIKTATVLKKELGSAEAFEQKIKDLLTENGIEIIVLAGFMAALICTSTSSMHGGLMLYNGGLTTGITALIMVPCLEYYFTNRKR